MKCVSKEVFTSSPFGVSGWKRERYLLPAAVECGVADIARETGRPRDATLLKKADPMTDLKQIRVFTVDDHPLMRRGIAGEVNEQTDMKVVAETVDGPEAIDIFRTQRPDVTLMDLRMPKVSGLQAMIEIRKVFPDARFIVLTTVAGDIQVVRAFEAGARGYLLKNLLRSELVDTIRAVHAGKKKVPPEVAQLLADHFTQDDLTGREVEILEGIAEGKSNKIVADCLNISENTVKNHVKSILSKLGASDRTHAVVIALQRGIIESN